MSTFVTAKTTCTHRKLDWFCQSQIAIDCGSEYLKKKTFPVRDVAICFMLLVVSVCERSNANICSIHPYQIEVTTGYALHALVLFYSHKDGRERKLVAAVTLYCNVRTFSSF